MCLGNQSGLPKALNLGWGCSVASGQSRTNIGDFRSASASDERIRSECQGCKAIRMLHLVILCNKTFHGAQMCPFWVPC